MYRRRTRFPSLKRKRALLRSRQVFHAKCFKRIRDTNAIQIVARQKSLDPLDLAVETSAWKRKWVNEIRLKMIRCLPPNCAEYLLPEILPKGTTLGQEFQRLTDFIEMQLDVLLQTRQHFITNLYVPLETQIMFHDNCDQSEVLRIVRNYLRLVKVIRPFQLDISAFPFNELFKSLLNTLCNELAEESSLAVSMVHWIRSACIDEESKTSIFLSISELRCLEYMLCVARSTRFDFWGLRTGEGDLSKSFNPVAVYFDKQRYSLARILLKYGFPYSVTENMYEDRCHTLAAQRYHGMPIITLNDVDAIFEKRGERMLLILDIFITFLNFERDDHSGALFTLIYISRSLPYPYVTSSELFRCLSGHMQPTFHRRLIEICRKYSSEEIYDDDYKEYKPRKLIHLCRCAIRKVLAKNLKLPDGLDDLNIPDSLKEYLLLER